MPGKKSIAIVLAAGQGKRMGTATAKQFLLLGDKPVLYYALKAFEDSAVDGIVLVTAADEIEYCRQEIVEKYQFRKVIAITQGGQERYHSVYQGIQKIKELSEEQSFAPELVFVHDGARPFVTVEMIGQLMEETRKCQACVSATPVKDTIKIADEDGFCETTPKRKLVWAVQTPQVFTYDVIVMAYSRLIRQEDELLRMGMQITDDAMVVETMLQKKVRLVEGSYRNIKLTTPEDLLVAKAFLDDFEKIEKN